MAQWALSRYDGVAVATFTGPPSNFMSLFALEQLAALLGEAVVVRL